MWSFLACYAPDREPRGLPHYDRNAPPWPRWLPWVLIAFGSTFFACVMLGGFMGWI